MRTRTGGPHRGGKEGAADAVEDPGNGSAAEGVLVQVGVEEGSYLPLQPAHHSRVRQARLVTAVENNEMKIN